jgi:hypothetical protein
MNKHLIPDRTTLPRLPYRLLIEGWWLEENANSRDNIVAAGRWSSCSRRQYWGGVGDGVCS